MCVCLCLHHTDVAPPDSKNVSCYYRKTCWLPSTLKHSASRDLHASSRQIDSVLVITPTIVLYIYNVNRCVDSYICTCVLAIDEFCDNAEGFARMCLIYKSKLLNRAWQLEWFVWLMTIGFFELGYAIHSNTLEVHLNVLHDRTSCALYVLCCLFPFQNSYNLFCHKDLYFFVLVKHPSLYSLRGSPVFCSVRWAFKYTQIYLWRSLPVVFIYASQ